MTDVQVTIEGCDHVMTPDEAERKARELSQLAQEARHADAKLPEFTIERGLVTKREIGIITAEFYVYGSRQWKTNTSRLWNTIVYLNEDWRWCEHHPHVYKFTVMCFSCGQPIGRCTQHTGEDRYAVSISELFENAGIFHVFSPRVSTSYRRLLRRVKVLQAT